MTREEVKDVLKFIIHKCDLIINNENYTADDYVQDNVEDIAVMCHKVLDGAFGEIVPNPDAKELLHDEFMKGFEEGYTRAVNDALKWFTENAENYIWFMEGDCGLSDDFEHDFKEAMR